MGNNELKPNIRWNSWSNNPFNENIWYTKRHISYWQTLCNNLVILTFKYFFWQSKRANVIFNQNWWCWTLFFLAFKSLLYFVTLYFCVFLQFGPHLYFFDLRLDKRRKEYEKFWIEYDTFSAVVECWVCFWSDFQSGSRVLKRCYRPILMYSYGIQCVSMHRNH